MQTSAPAPLHHGDWPSCWKYSSVLFNEFHYKWREGNCSVISCGHSRTPISEETQMESFTAWPLLCCPEAVSKKRLNRLQSGHLLRVIRWWNQDTHSGSVKPWFPMQWGTVPHTSVWRLSWKVQELEYHISLKIWHWGLLFPSCLRENPGKHALSEILHSNTWLSPVTIWSVVQKEELFLSV